MKKLGIARLGAYGDMVILSSVLPHLKKEGWHIELETTDMGIQVLRHNPYVDKYILNKDHLDYLSLRKYLDEREKEYDRYINLCESIERTLAVVPWDEIYQAPREEREARCNVNYYDHLASLCNLKERGLRGDLHFSSLEHQFGRDFRKKHRGKFILLWAMSGSSVHKAYPYADEVALSFLHKHEDSVIVTVGDTLSELIEWEHPRTINRSGKWPIRKSLLMTKYSDCVIGVDTGVMHGAACFETPKILMHSAASPKNISEHWTNTVNLSANVWCQPCYRLLYDIDLCPKDKAFKTSLCIAELKPQTVFDALEDQYERWKYGINIHDRRETVLSGR